MDGHLLRQQQQQMPFHVAQSASFGNKGHADRLTGLTGLTGLTVRDLPDLADRPELRDMPDLANRPDCAGHALTWLTRRTAIVG